LPSFPPPRYAIFTHGYELRSFDTPRHRRTLLGAHVLLANSSHSAERLREFFPGHPSVRVVRLCIDPDRVRLWESQSPPVLPARRVAAIVVARMDPAERSKGHDALIEAWPGVQRRVPAAMLWIVGQGDDLPRLRDKARSAGIGDAVVFHGHVSDVELSALYHRAAVFVMPSRQEGFGLAYAEAMWHGLPCIGSTADASGEVIGDCGQLVPYGDREAIAAAVAEFLADDDRRRLIDPAARRRARERFGFERFRNDLIEALQLA
jgi:phosphatidylinositol alpha-1,6-mannosyltransferase